MQARRLTTPADHVSRRHLRDCISHLDPRSHLLLDLAERCEEKEDDCLLSALREPVGRRVHAESYMAIGSADFVSDRRAL